jgi:alanyl-tRNA synthetase
VHRATVLEGEGAVGEDAEAEVDVVRRRSISRAHTATHMVHQALRDELGDTATQAGSENSPGRLRFDFRSQQAVPAGALGEIESRINGVLLDDLPVTADIMAIDDARKLGAMALFGEKYGERVRVVSIGDWSRELCIGTHTPRVGQIGVVKLLGESSIGSGVRRVEALVGVDAYTHLAREAAIVSQLTEVVGGRRDELPDRIAGILGRLRDAEKEIAAVKQAQVLGAAGGLVSSARDIGGVRFVSHDAGDGVSADELRALVLDVRTRLGNEAPTLVSMAAVSGGRPVVIVATNEQARQAGLQAGALVKVAAQALGGGGGGKPDLAQGGGTDPTQVSRALGVVEDQLRARGA